MYQIIPRIHRHKLRYHLIGWLAFIVYDSGSSWLVNGYGSPLIDSLFFYGCNISLFYCHYQLLALTIEKSPPRYFRAAALIVPELLLFALFKASWEYYRIPLRQDTGPATYSIGQVIFVDLIRCVYYAGLSTLTWAAGSVANFRRKTAEAATEKLKLEKRNALLAAELSANENAYLQQQLNPHLLLNTLSFIYNSVYRHSREGAEVVLKLADIMRFSLDETDPDGLIPLTRELEQIQNLVAINRSRFSHPLLLDLEIPQVGDSIRIIPLILLTLTENMFKHGDFRMPGASIRLIADANGQLSFSTVNAKRNQSALPAGSGIGMRNTRLRLAHRYPGTHTLTIEEDAEQFSLNLTIQL